MCCFQFSATIPPVIGEYRTVGCLPFRFPNSCYTRIFYPTSEIISNPEVEKKISELYNYNVGNKGLWRYIRPGVSKGTSKFSGTSEALIKYTIGKNNVENFQWALTPTFEEEKQFPIIIFSHGLGGNADIYSKICSEMASIGYIVIALEHEDGSGAYAFDIEKNEPIFYTPVPKDLVYNRENVNEFRAPFLEKRINEITQIISFLKHDEISTFENFKLSEELEKSIFSLMNKNRIIMSGHSFGGATASKVVFDFENPKEEDFEFKNCFESLILFDTWSVPLSEEVTKNGINTPMIAFMSDQFHDNGEYFVTQELLNSSKNVKLATYVKDTAHSQFSDGPWFSGIQYIKRKNGFEGKQSSTELYAAVLEVIEDFLKDPENYEKAETDATAILLPATL